tara:strand:- start:1 stop:132 length:132 start_codon:yes stop_codon:yes gene_type:complete
MLLLKKLNLNLILHYYKLQEEQHHLHLLKLDKFVLKQVNLNKE